MKIAISYPPLSSEKGIPLLSQNRQFQWFKEPTYIFPVVPAYAATMLKVHGFDVFWDDAIAEGLSFEAWMHRMTNESPDLVVIETKTPVVQKHWRIVGALKDRCPHIKIAMVGDHVTALPDETMQNSKVDFLLTGGDYDFLLLHLCRLLRQSTKAGELKDKEEKKLEAGIWYRKNAHIHNTGHFVLNHDLSSLPIIDRDLTHWQWYARKNGNFKYLPGTYVMAARDCWWGRCTFCSWTTLYPGKSYRTVPVERHLDEIGHLIEKYGVREIFDDSGCFPKGEWLEDFCRGIIDRGYHKRVTLGCNTRVGAQTADQFRLMKKANFRFVLIGVESVNRNTIQRLRKGIRVEDIEKTCRSARKAGLEPHVTTMVGYPWEQKKDVDSTIRFVKKMFHQGVIDSLQATIVIPYPGTPLFKEAQKKGWLVTTDWERYDMKESVWKETGTCGNAMGAIRRLYWSAISPGFLLRKVARLRSFGDVLHYLKAGRKLLGHVADFRE